ncbi:MAG: hypothetical protein WCL56_11610 [Sediminibacterium sp.]
MLSETARTLFSKLLDANTSRSEAIQNNDLISYMKYDQEYNDIESQIIDDMGKKQWTEFMNMGRKMFEPATK